MDREVTQASPLLLVPTLFEARQLLEPAACGTLASRAYAHSHLDDMPIEVALCGFGLAAAGAGAAHAICRYRAHHSSSTPGHVLLAGIAGTYDRLQAPVGSALIAARARCVGIGAGAGRAHRSAAALGWHQGITVDGEAEVADELAFWRAAGDAGGAAGALLLSVTSASGSTREAAARLAAHPGAVAEEMEAFAVGLAARLAGVPLVVVRGISNVAGDRRRAAWRTADALAETRTLLVRTLRAATGATRTVEAAHITTPAAERGGDVLANGQTT